MKKIDNYSYLANKVKELKNHQNEIKILDYGSGSGKLVKLINESVVGARCYGVDVYSRMNKKIEEHVDNYSSDIFSSIDDNGCVPYEDCYFDLVVSNQVFEHIQEFDTPIAEINRILKPNGKFIILFPTREVIIEGHCGIPFMHLFINHYKLQYFITYLFGLVKFCIRKDNNLNIREWVVNRINYVNLYTFYLPRNLAMSKLKEKFEVDCNLSHDLFLWKYGNKYKPLRFIPWFIIDIMMRYVSGVSFQFNNRK